ncbi:MAG: hypothetical protein ABI824_15345 [Acidobacteriota bacterium]
MSSRSNGGTARLRAFAAILLTIFLLPLSASGADLVFTASIRFLRPEFLTVRLADGRVISARLPKSPALSAAAISTHYKIADQVEITFQAHFKLLG